MQPSREDGPFFFNERLRFRQKFKKKDWQRQTNWSVACLIRTFGSSVDSRRMNQEIKALAKSKCASLDPHTQNVNALLTVNNCKIWEGSKNCSRWIPIRQSLIASIRGISVCRFYHKYLQERWYPDWHLS